MQREQHYYIRQCRWESSRKCTQWLIRRPVFTPERNATQREALCVLLRTAKFKTYANLCWMQDGQTLHIFNSLYRYKCWRQNEAEFTTMLSEFMIIKIKLQFLCSRPTSLQIIMSEKITSDHYSTRFTIALCEIYLNKFLHSFTVVIRNNLDTSLSKAFLTIRSQLPPYLFKVICINLYLTSFLCYHFPQVR